MTVTQDMSLTERLASGSSASHIGSYKSGSEEWHAIRRSGIGGTHVATILGLSRWESPWSLWAKKTGLVDERVEPNEAMEWGHRLEPVILGKFADAHPELTVHRDVGTWRHSEREWQIANPDAIFETDTGEFGIIEVKTATYEDDWVDGVPRGYQAQVQWYLHTFGFESAYVVALFHGNKYREFEISANEFAQEVALERVIDFRKCLETVSPPEFDGATATYETVRKLRADIVDDEVELGYLGEQYFSAAARVSEAETALLELKSRILDAMGTARRGLVHGEWTFTRQARSGNAPFLALKRG